MSTEVNILSSESVFDLPENLVLVYCKNVSTNSNKQVLDKNLLLSKTLKTASVSLELFYEELTVERELTGKPKMKNLQGDSIGLSITHSDELFICGLNRKGEIGIDTEKVDRIINPRLLNRILHNEEQLSHFKSVIQLWTLKEAVLKLIGTGLRTNMNKLQIKPKSDFIFEVNHNNYELTIVSFEHRNHWISVAYT
jgi:phosphopantetheinyl transferase